MRTKQNQITETAVQNTSRRHTKQLTLRAVLLPIVGFSLLLFHANAVMAQTDSPAATGASNAPTLVIGFMGGFVHSDDLRHSEAQLAQRLQRNYGDRIQVEMFENRQRAKAHEQIIEWLGGLEGTGEQMPQPHIILFGHSWGASAVVYLARELERDAVPVALTVQVDSVRKHGKDDSLIPANVAEAVNFYQPDGILHGQPRILAADPSRTTIVGNYRFTYAHEPAACHAYPWHDRLLFKGHTAIECDPQVWSHIERLIETRLPRVKPVDTEVVEQLTR